MSLKPYKSHCLTILSMWENNCSTGMCSDSKYSNATGSLILLKPSFFKSAKSVFFKPFWVKIALFQVCSSHEMLTPLSKLLALLKANKRAGGVVGLLFVIILCIVSKSTITTIRNTVYREVQNECLYVNNMFN